MALVTAPLLSFSSRGQIGKSVVFSSWKGRAYARQLVTPANPKSVEQVKTRSVFSWLENVWKYYPATAIAAWTLAAASQQYTNRNAWFHANIAALRAGTTITPIILSPSAGGGFAAAAISVAATAGTLTATITAPSLPAGWSITEAWAAAIRQQDPHSGTNYAVVAASDNATPFTPALGGLTASQVYIVGGWFKFTKPDGSFAYGQSVQTTGTPS